MANPFGCISSKTYDISKVVEQTCADFEQSQAEKLEKAPVVVPKWRRWIWVGGQPVETAVEMDFAKKYY